MSAPGTLVNHSQAIAAFEPVQPPGESMTPTLPLRATAKEAIPEPRLETAD